MILENFRAFIGTHEIDFKDLNQAVVIGKNGNGKSSLFIDAPLYALKGQARKRAENLISLGCESMSVTFVFSHNGQQYTIKREQKGSKQALKLLCGDKDISERLLTATQKKLDEIVNISYDLLLSTTVCQQEDINKLAQMTPGDRESILNEMLGYSKWERKKEKVNKILSEYKDLDKTIETTKSQIAVNTEKINSLTLEVAENKKKADFYKELKEKYEGEVADLEEQFKNYETFIKIQSEYRSVNSVLEQLKKNLTELPDVNQEVIYNLIKTLESEIKDNNETVIEIDQQINHHRLNVINIYEQIQEINTYIKLEPQTQILNDVPCVGLDIHDQCKLLSSALSTKQSIDKYMKDNRIENLSTFQVTLTMDRKTFEDKVKFFDQSKATINNEISEAKIKINQQKELLRQADKKAVLETEIEIKQTKVVDLASQMKQKPSFDNDLYMTAKDNFNKTNIELGKYELTIAKQDTEAGLLLKTNLALSVELDKYNDTQEKLANYKVLQQAYSEIPTLLFEQAIPTIEEYTNKILAKIFPSEQIQLRSFKETKSNTLQKALDIVGMDGLDPEDKSGSEQIRRSLALRIALAQYNSEQNGIQMPMMIIDEGGFGNLDEENLEVLKLMLKEIATNFELFLVITHLTALKNVFDTQIVVNPTGKGSKVEIYG